MPSQFDFTPMIIFANNSLFAMFNDKYTQVNYRQLRLWMNAFLRAVRTG